MLGAPAPILVSGCIPETLFCLLILLYALHLLNEVYTFVNICAMRSVTCQMAPLSRSKKWNGAQIIESLKYKLKDRLKRSLTDLTVQSSGLALAMSFVACQ